MQIFKLEKLKKYNSNLKRSIYLNSTSLSNYKKDIINCFPYLFTSFDYDYKKIRFKRIN